VAEARDRPLARWGEELRRHRSARRAGRVRAAAAAAAGFAAAALLATILWPPRPLLLWNGSDSSPIGLYRVTAPSNLMRGETVIAWPPPGARRLASDRRYLPSTVPLVKRVAGVRGDRICGIGASVFVNGEVAAERRGEDSLGRPLPSWTGCQALQPGEYLLLTENGASFDGRYFGVTAASDILGRATLLSGR
jgi:conjugative transfer signal peptidase TraF